MSMHFGFTSCFQSHSVYNAPSNCCQQISTKLRHFFFQRPGFSSHLQKIERQPKKRLGYLSDNSAFGRSSVHKKMVGICKRRICGCGRFPARAYYFLSEVVPQTTCAKRTCTSEHVQVNMYSHNEQFLKEKKPNKMFYTSQKCHSCNFFPLACVEHTARPLMKIPVRWKQRKAGKTFQCVKLQSGNIIFYVNNRRQLASWQGTST